MATLSLRHPEPTIRAMDVLVIGGGIAGVAAACAAARGGARTVLVERAHHLGGEAVRGCHRTLCGLAPIDAIAAELLEPELTGAWLPLLTTGKPQRRGRVWLWPTAPATLMAGLRSGLHAAGVEVRLGHAVQVAEDGTVRLAERDWRPAAIIDASGAACGPGTRRASAQLGAWRLEFAADVEDTPAGRRQALRAIAELAPAAALEPLGDGRWQLSLDVGDTTLAAAQALGETAVQALGGHLLAGAVAIASRDAGGYDGLSCETLFSEDHRGLAWAAWPSELHTPDGVRWVWPPRDRHGLPLALAKPAGAPAWWWCCGRGLAASPTAAAALRVTGTALALGGALGAHVAAS